jgi:hypothetical protein
VCSTGAATNNDRVPFSTSSPSQSAEAAITAFLHGIERRAWVFARAQCGEEALAEQAVGLAIREFRWDCGGKPLSSWPRDFWSILLAQPALLQGQSRLLPELTVGPRAALLLRLVAGLDIAHAAQVLGVSEAAYRAALAHALEQLHAAGRESANLESLREQLQQEIRQAPTVFRTAAKSAPYGDETDGPAAGSPEQDDAVDADPARWHPWLKAALALVLLAFVLSFFWQPWHSLAPGESEPLPPEEIAALAPADASAAVTHPDFALLAAPEDEALARDLAFYIWLAAGGQAAAADQPPASPGSIAPTAPTTPIAPPAAPVSTTEAKP